MEIIDERAKSQLKALMRNNFYIEQRVHWAAKNCSSPELKKFLFRKLIEFQKFDLNLRTTTEYVFNTMDLELGTDIVNQSQVPLRRIPSIGNDRLLVENVILSDKAVIAQFSYVLINRNLPHLPVQIIEKQICRIRSSLSVLKRMSLREPAFLEVSKVLPKANRKSNGLDQTVNTLHKMLFN